MEGAPENIETQDEKHENWVHKAKEELIIGLQSIGLGVAAEIVAVTILKQLGIETSPSVQGVMTGGLSCLAYLRMKGHI